jgi:hypothetical protein
MKFLKPVRDNCGDCLLNTPSLKAEVPKEEAPLEPYVKNNACTLMHITLVLAMLTSTGSRRSIVWINRHYLFYAETVLVATTGASPSFD